MRAIAGLIPLCLLLAGCHNGANPFMAGQTPQNGAAVAGAPAGPLDSFVASANQTSQYASAQLQDAQRRLAQLDSGNRELTAQIAQAQQALQSERDRNKLVQQQLADAGNKLKELVAAKDDAERKASAVFASQKQVAGATITANNSIRTSLRTVEIAGLEVRQDGTTIRIEIPSDRLFSPGTYQLLPQAGPLLDEVAAAVRKNYQRQLLVVEGHTDASAALAASPAMSHQLAAAQSHAVLDYLVTRSQLPAGQISSMAFGSHRPRVSNATPQGQAKNRRVEIVIYPDTLDGKP